MSKNHSIQEVAYEKYKLDWMLRQSYTINDLIASLHAYQEDVFSPLPDLFGEWETEAGFDGCLWVCFEEFLGAEYLDEEYMKSLLSDSEYNQYLLERGRKVPEQPTRLSE